MNPDILPDNAWKEDNEYFNAADGKTFHTAFPRIKLEFSYSQNAQYGFKLLGASFTVMTC